ncbi:MAG: ABC transporter permease, partial [bacterium]
MNEANKTGNILHTVKGLLLKPEVSSFLIFIFMFGITATLQEHFFTIKSTVRNINAFTPLILLAMGQAVVIVSGGLDLSSGAALSLFTCILTTVMKRNDPVTGVYALLITFAAAILVGIVNGVGIGYLRIPPVIVTFATSYMWLGIALFLRPTPGGETVDWFRGFYKIDAVAGAPALLKAMGNVIPPAFLLLLTG